MCQQFLDVDGDDTVYVCDRENDRIQLFTSEGEYVTEWAGLNRPADVYIDRKREIIYVGELGSASQPPRMSIRDLQGKEISGWEGHEADGQGVLGEPHGIGVDSQGNIYEGSIVRCPRVQKFAKL